MYAAIWIDDTKKTANEKITVCKPLLKRENTAWAVLNGKKHGDSASIILSGDGANLTNFIAYIDTRDDEWGDLSGNDLMSKVIEEAKGMGLSTVEAFGTAPSGIVRPSGSREPPEKEGLLSKYIDVAKAIKDSGNPDLAGRIARYIPIKAALAMPKAGFYPRHINSQAKKTWDDVVKRYKKTIYKAKPDTQRMWVIALIIFRRSCAKHGVLPFLADPNRLALRGRMAEDINQKANSGAGKAAHRILQLTKKLHKSGMLSTVTKLKFHEVAKYKGRFYVTMYQRIKPKSNTVPADIIKELRYEWGLKGGKDWAHQKLDSVTDILFEDEAPELWVYTTTYLTKDQAIIVFDMDDDSKDVEILKRLKSRGKKWLSSKTLLNTRMKNRY